MNHHFNCQIPEGTTDLRQNDGMVSQFNDWFALAIESTLWRSAESSGRDDKFAAQGSCSSRLSREDG